VPWRGSLPGFGYVSAISDVYSSDGWDGEVGLITDLGEAPGRAQGCGYLRLRRRRWGKRRWRARQAGRARGTRLLRQVHHHW
jgi:hypothetical protein